MSPHLCPPPNLANWNPSSSSSDDEDEGQDEDALKAQAYRAALQSDIGTDVHTVDAVWATSLYEDLVDDKAIDDFLREPESGYVFNVDGTGRWIALPTSPCHRSALHGPVTALIASIVNIFSSSGLPNVVREVVSSHERGFKHEGFENGCPDISIRATGPSFHLPSQDIEYVAGTAFSNVSAVIDVGLDAELATDDDQVLYTAIYCRFVSILHSP